MLTAQFQDLLPRWVEGGGSLPWPDHQQALQAFLDGKTSPEEAAAAYTRDMPLKDPKFTETEDLYRLLELVAQEFPETQDQLIELLKAMRVLPQVLRDSDQYGDRGGERYWIDLPGFRFDLREYHAGQIDCARQSSDPHQCSYFINLSSFIAKFIRNDIFALEVYAVQTLAEALESSHDSESQSLDTFVNAAARYILQAARAIYVCDKENLGGYIYWDEDSHTRQPTGPLLREARRTRTVKRWDFWKERFTLMKARENLKESTRVLAGRAADEMYNFQPIQHPGGTL